MARTFKKEDAVVRFQHKDNGRIVRLLETSDVGTVLVQYEDDGKTTNYSKSTWQRWWKQLDEVVEDVEDVPVEQEEEVAGDGTPYSQVMDEILQDEQVAVEKKAKEKKERKPRIKATSKPTFDSTELQEFCVQYVEELGGSFTVRKLKDGKEMNSRVFRDSNEHMFAHMHYSKYQLYIDTRGIDTDKLPADKTLTGFYESRYYFTEDTKQVRDKIKKILSQGFKAQVSRRTKKEDK